MKKTLYIFVAFMLCIGFTASASAQQIIDDGGIILGEDKSKAEPNTPPREGGYPAQRTGRADNIREKQAELRALHTEKTEAAKEIRATKVEEAQANREIKQAERAAGVAERVESREGNMGERADQQEERKEAREIKQEEMGERREAKKTEMDAKRLERRAEAVEKIQARADQYLDRIVKRFEAAIERVEQIAERVGSRLQKIQNEKDVDLSAALGLVTDAKGALADARAELGNAQDDGENVILDIQNAIDIDIQNEANTLQSQVKPSFNNAKTKFRAVHEHIKRAHTLLRDAVKAAKEALVNARPTPVENATDDDADGSVGTN